MNSNHPKTIQELLALPEEFDERLQIKTRGYLYHGSPDPNITELEPRQAIHHGMPDGEPVVCAGKNLQDSIFISLFNRSRLEDPSSGASGWSRDNSGPTTYTATRDVIVIAKKSKGYLYLLDPDNFDWVVLEDPIHKSKRELRSLEAVKPLAKIEVTISDFDHEVKEIRLEDL
ncbi:MAG: hypothetical protein H6799_01020 [Candidatus Nomurabacteria bacterium]|nr:MAG: hypothetical protein H6799_01020 [Candidatus Nomurabacteria bacterium]